MLTWIGWAATAVFAVSYFFKTPTRLRQIQATAALMWIAYGAMIHAWPVIVANVIVAIAAAVSAFRASPEQSGIYSQEREARP